MRRLRGTIRRTGIAGPDLENSINLDISISVSVLHSYSCQSVIISSNHGELTLILPLILAACSSLSAKEVSSKLVLLPCEP